MLVNSRIDCYDYDLDESFFCIKAVYWYTSISLAKKLLYRRTDNCRNL